MKAKLLIVSVLLASVAGRSKSSPAEPGLAGPTLTVPTPVTHVDLAQLTTLRPTLIVQNGTSDTAGARTYEFQISDKSDFSSTSSSGSFPALARQTGIAEGTSGTTSFTPDFDMQPTTKLYWRARMTQGTSSSSWSATRSFNTAIVGYNRPGELFDPLVNGTTIGTVTGSVTFLPGQGVQLNDGFAYIRYLLPQTVSAGEFSLEIAGLHPNGPGGKLKLFSMSDSTGSVYDSPWLFTVQYRGSGGNPDNCIAWKMRLADPAFQLEPDGNDRNKNVVSLDPSNFYFFKATWNDGFRMIVQTSITGGKFYDLEYKSTDYFNKQLFLYQPSPHFAYLGANNQREGAEQGTFPGEILRNVFIGSKPRPTTLGNAMAVR